MRETEIQHDPMSVEELDIDAIVAEATDLDRIAAYEEDDSEDN